MSKYRITLNGKVYEMEVERIDGAAPAKTEAPAAPAPAAISASAVVSPMPGTVLKVMADEGETVKAGQPVLVLEAMKMENEITAPKDGQIAALHVKQGDAVQGGAVLFEIDD